MKLQQITSLVGHSHEKQLLLLNTAHTNMGNTDSPLALFRRALMHMLAGDILGLFPTDGDILPCTVRGDATKSLPAAAMTVECSL